MIRKILYTAIAIVALVMVFKLMGLHQAYGVMYSTETFGNAIGPDKADQVLVEVFDYRCSYCRDMYGDLMRFHERNQDVKIIFRPWPIIDKASIDQADLALAAGMQGKFFEVHDLLMQEKHTVDDAFLADITRRFGLDPAKLKLEMKGRETGRILLDTHDAAAALGIQSAPTFIAGKIVYSPKTGLPGVEDLEKLVAEAYPE